MNYKTILVQMGDDERSEFRLRVAIDLARIFEAHLIGLHLVPPMPGPQAVLGLGSGNPIGVRRQRMADEARRAGARFKKVTARSAATSVEWRSVPFDPVKALALQSRYVDLVVLGQPARDDDSGLDLDLVGECLLSISRPTLLVPFVGRFESLGRRPIIAWNASPEATRAVTDALPFLQRAERVHVMAFNAGGRGHGELPGADVGLWLTRHGVPVEVSEERAEEINVGELLLSRVSDLNCDLVVMGAYGRSRLRELLLGGVTQTVLESMTVPVLMSH